MYSRRIYTPKFVKVLSYSSGNINNEMIDFQTVYECDLSSSRRV